MDITLATRAAIDELKKQNNWNYVSDAEGYNYVVLDGTFDIEKVVHAALLNQVEH